MTDTTVAIETLRLHPDAERVPLAAPDDLANLKGSLAENGQQDPIDITTDGVILDGRTRWTLLRDLGAQTVMARVVAVPEDQQTHYIVDRALARRHLTLAQKRALNDLLRVQVVEVRQPATTSRATEPMRIGHSQTDRAAKLGVDLGTVKRWDDGGLVGASAPSRLLPTHAIDRRGRPQPLHKTQPEDRKPRAQTARPAPLRKSRPIPGWSRHFSMWCRSARPEDREFFHRIDRELHAALDRNGIRCEREVAS